MNQELQNKLAETYTEFVMGFYGRDGVGYRVTVYIKKAPFGGGYAVKMKYQETVYIKKAPFGGGYAVKMKYQDVPNSRFCKHNITLPEALSYMSLLMAEYGLSTEWELIGN